MNHYFHSDLFDALFYYALGVVIALPMIFWFHDGQLGVHSGFVLLFAGGMGTRYLYRYVRRTR